MTFGGTDDTEGEALPNSDVEAEVCGVEAEVLPNRPPEGESAGLSNEIVNILFERNLLGKHRAEFWFGSSRGEDGGRGGGGAKDISCRLERGGGRGPEDGGPRACCCPTKDRRCSPEDGCGFGRAENSGSSGGGSEGESCLSSGDGDFLLLVGDIRILLVTVGLLVVLNLTELVCLANLKKRSR